ncbi:MAG: cysteine dioxygenase family protein [Actinomycetota bacterium]|nr:cysteine dioxygenase family protein [Actinomycetota bacterium]
MSTTFTPDTDELRKIAELPTEAALRRAAAFLASLVKNPHFVQSQILPALDEVRDIEDCYLARRHDAKDGSYSLKIFVWPPGTGTKIHDYSFWVAYLCAWGSVLEERYERLDDGSRAGHARLKKVLQLWWSPEDSASTAQPGEGGIHRVGNPQDETAVSVHLYGPRKGGVYGRDYDASRDHVCDRREDQVDARDAAEEIGM